MPILLKKGAELKQDAVDAATELRDLGYTMKYDAGGNYRIQNNAGEDYRGDLLAGLGVGEGIFTDKRRRKRLAGDVFQHLYSEGFWGPSDAQQKILDDAKAKAAAADSGTQEQTTLTEQMDKDLQTKLRGEVPKAKTLAERQKSYNDAIKIEFEYEDEENVPDITDEGDDTYVRRPGIYDKYTVGKGVDTDSQGYINQDWMDPSNWDPKVREDKAYGRIPKGYTGPINNEAYEEWAMKHPNKTVRDWAGNEINPFTPIIEARSLEETFSARNTANRQRETEAFWNNVFPKNIK